MNPVICHLAAMDINEAAVATERFTSSHLDDIPSPFSELLGLVRVERECRRCGGAEEGWAYVDRMLHGLNRGLATTNVYWDGCPCSPGAEAWFHCQVLVVDPHTGRTVPIVWRSA